MYSLFANLDTTVKKMKSSYSWYTEEMKTLQEKFTTTLGDTTKALDVQATSAKNNSDELFKQLGNTLSLVTATDSFKVSIDKMLPSLIDYTKKIQAMVTALKDYTTQENVQIAGTPKIYSPASPTIEGSHSEGGIVDYQGLSQLHGSKSSPEVVFNSGQAKKLWELVKNLPDGLDIGKLINNSVSTVKNIADSFIPTDFAKNISSVINKSSQSVQQVFNIDKLEFPNIKDGGGVESLIQGLNSYAIQYSKR